MIPITIDKAVKFVLEPSHLNVIVKALEELPFKHAKPVIDALHAQIMEQYGPKPPEPPNPAG